MREVRPCVRPNAPTMRNALRELRARGGALTRKARVRPFGETHVLCAASLEDKPPPWLRGQGRGWVTAEYAMLPRATLTRTKRKSSAGKVSGRSQEIQRLMGRCVVVGGAICHASASGKSLSIATCCRRTAAPAPPPSPGACVALRDCLNWMTQRSILRESPIKDHVAAARAVSSAAKR